MASKYQIRADGVVLADIIQREYSYFNAVLTEKKNDAGTLVFSLLKENPVASYILPLKTTIQLYENKKIIWIGRVVNSKKNLYNQTTITCEGALSWFRDVQIPSTDFSETDVNSVVNSVLTTYNSLCSDNRKINIGTIEGADPISIKIQERYATAFEIFSKIIKTNGGFFAFDYQEDGTPILNYYKEPKDVGIVVRFGENLIDINQFIDPTNVITCLYAEGDGISLPEYIINEKAVDNYGKIYGSVVFDDVTDQDKLLEEANKYLSQNMLGDVSITVKSINLNKRAKVGDSARVISPPHGIDIETIVSEVATDLNNIANGSVTVGSSKKTLTKSIVLGG